ncbi:DUF1214 domain-containing protein [Mesorhizobium sp. RP14(2022)]|uniref:DUF1214 domain-containing protein n=1 Tax=Mesorhizobium liriopis TaxID=2953882 RepID=A0ABT1C1U1_9HYPH|nr:DUF1214 domain-containing protein [Mesorhizobium liriopis]MCO6048628.1 DUF1214 domain-containing protein [Mesorhizobium liriopis]
MTRAVALVLLAFLIAIGGGAGTLYLALERPIADPGRGWLPYPGNGSSDADPYQRAQIALRGILPLGRSEGLAFIARHDATGASFKANCSYVLEGPMPVARFWTLFAANTDLRPLAPKGARPAAIHSLQTLHSEDGSVSVNIGRAAQSGNWLSTGDAESWTLVLTLYDTPTAGGLALGTVSLPTIRRSACDG